MDSYREKWGISEDKSIRTDAPKVFYDKVVETVQSDCVKIVWDLWCWTWELLKKINKASPWLELYGYDLNYPYNKQYNSENVTYKKHNLDKKITGMDGNFDFLISKFVIMYLEHFDKHCRNIYDLLNKDGVYQFITLNPEHIQNKLTELGRKNKYNTKVKYLIESLNIEADYFLTSLDKMEKAITESGLEIIKNDSFYAPNPKYSFEERIPQTIWMSLKK